ncbi:hypothetical protein [Hymenobacter pini]|uniref:hypothetical protein n=1 Tax=Hymenobacter pini TaxID=2880879 RepID=UPI001CF5C0EB|nr:hypothetical protein [Hymenobacter pini]MCA8831984.1 hypothetical protein [Hymenobacter pini]
MSQPPEKLAPAHESACFLAYMALHSRVSAPALEELRQLLQHYPPRRIARCLAEARSLLTVEEEGPQFKYHYVGYQQLLLGLLDLADAADASSHANAA